MKDEKVQDGASGERRRIFTTSNPKGSSAPRVISTDSVPEARARAREAGRIEKQNIKAHRQALAERLQKMGVNVRKEKTDEA